MNVVEICEKIKAPQEMLRYVSEKLAPQEALQALTDIGTAPSGYARIKELVGNDNNGLKMFACMINAAAIAFEKYQNLGIGEEIFTDTMSCFTRFVNEYRASFGVYGFDRGWWTYRQLSCVLFKIGELEYEYCDDEKTIHLHIPSGSNIGLANCKKSLDEFNAFSAKYFPEKRYPIVCNSWLLSPALDKLLCPQSNIIKFRKCFDIIRWDKTQTDFLQWVYGKVDIEYDSLPERTSLQKNMKNYLIAGGLIGSAFGRLIDFA